MTPAPLPADEPDRLRALRRLNLLDTLPERGYDDLTRLASLVCGTPIALVSLVDQDRQWFKSKHGIEAEQTGRDEAFCAHAILGDDLFEVPDALRDGRFADNPLVTGAPHVRFYAGVPLSTPDGHHVGTVCVIDRGPKALSPAQADALRGIARQVMALMQLRLQVDALRESEEKFRRVLQRLAEAVFLIDPDTKAVLEANAAAADLYGFPPDDPAGLTLYDLSAHGRDDIDAHCRRVGDRLAAARRHRRRDGSPLDVELSASEVTHGGRRVLALVVRDVTERLHAQRQLEEANARLAALARTDGLTGVPNRPAFDARLADELDRARRTGRPLSVLLFDVDHFKAFNDTFGHPAGDDVLRSVAGLLRDAVRATDLLARYGGEEFVAVLPETDDYGALALAERCRAAVAGHGWRLRPITVSVGAATGGSDGLVEDADRALYRSKRAGRDRVTHAGPGVSYARAVPSS